MKAATTLCASPRIHSKQSKKKIHESFSTDADGMLHTIVLIGRVGSARSVSMSVEKFLLLFGNFVYLKAFLLGVLKGLKDSTHSAVLASLF
jgi:hypothetical protein